MMSAIDYIALSIIILLFICAIRYMIVSRKNGKCNGSCSDCTYCSKKNRSDK